jgi:hypothetical protein
MTISIDADLEFTASPAAPPEAFSADGVRDLTDFNEYGVRQTRDENGNLLSVDVVYRAMEPGLRKNVRVTPEFLARVAENFSGTIPLQYDHSHSQRANVGYVTDVWAGADALWLMATVPNTGSTIRSDTIADFTYQPPAITDGSVGFGRDYEVEFNEEAEEYAFVNASLAEFSLTPFPAGYDHGGLSPAFCEAASEVGLFVDDAAPEVAGNAPEPVAAEKSSTDSEVASTPAEGVSRARISDI